MFVLLFCRYGENTQEFLRQRDNSSPFLLYLAFAHMHVPQQHDPSFTNTSLKGTVFADTLREMDALVGNIAATLADQDLTDNTLIWFTGDNGPWDMKCNLTGSPGPFIGQWQRTTDGGGATMKRTTWEGGHRQVSIVVWPGQIQAGSSSNALTSMLDIMPTLAAIAGLQLASDRQYDGLDITHILKGASTTQDKSNMLTQEQFTRTGEMRHVRENNTGHAFLFHPNSGVGENGALQTVRYGQYKAHFLLGSSLDCAGKQVPVRNLSTPLLFDLANDPGEATPLNTTDFASAISAIQELLDSVTRNISTDMRSVADYGSDDAVRPCCSIGNAVCRCNP